MGFFGKKTPKVDQQLEIEKQQQLEKTEAETLLDDDAFIEHLERRSVADPSIRSLVENSDYQTILKEKKVFDTAPKCGEDIKTDIRERFQKDLKAVFNSPEDEAAFLAPVDEYIENISATDPERILEMAEAFKVQKELASNIAAQETKIAEAKKKIGGDAVLEKLRLSVEGTKAEKKEWIERDSKEKGRGRINTFFKKLFANATVNAELAKNNDLIELKKYYAAIRSAEAAKGEAEAAMLQERSALFSDMDFIEDMRMAAIEQHREGFERVVSDPNSSLETLVKEYEIFKSLKSATERGEALTRADDDMDFEADEAALKEAIANRIAEETRQIIDEALEQNLKYKDLETKVKGMLETKFNGVEEVKVTREQLSDVVKNKMKTMQPQPIKLKDKYALDRLLTSLLS